jgi:hypothetical protein
MKVRLLKDWNYRKSGEVVDVFEPTAKDWIRSGIAEEPVDQRSAVVVEQAVSRQQEAAERAVRKHSSRKSS